MIDAGHATLGASEPEKDTPLTGLTFDTGALIAIEAGSPRMALLVEQAIAAGAELAIPAGVVAQAWRGGARQVRIAKSLQLQVTSIVVLDAKLALRVGCQMRIHGVNGRSRCERRHLRERQATPGRH